MLFNNHLRGPPFKKQGGAWNFFEINIFEVGKYEINKVLLDRVEINILSARGVEINNILSAILLGYVRK